MSDYYIHPDSLNFTYFRPTTHSDNARMSTTQLNPEDYLEYAFQDLQEGGQRGLVNSFGNSKRSIHLIIDELLWQYGLLAQNEKQNFPGRLRILDSVGLLSARILNRLNIQRNEIEHDYVAPSQEAAQDAVDVASLLNLAARSLRSDVVCEAVVGHPNGRSHLVLRVDRNAGRLLLHTLRCSQRGAFGRIDGVRCFKGHVTDLEGNLIDGVKVDESPTEVIELKSSTMEKWRPVITFMIEVQRKTPGNRPRISRTISTDQFSAISRWMFSGGPPGKAALAEDEPSQ